jgi:hypothetical protein
MSVTSNTKLYFTEPKGDRNVDELAKQGIWRPGAALTSTCGYLER